MNTMTPCDVLSVENRRVMFGSWWRLNHDQSGHVKRQMSVQYNVELGNTVCSKRLIRISTQSEPNDVIYSEYSYYSKENSCIWRVEVCCPSHVKFAETSRWRVAVCNSTSCNGSVQLPYCTISVAHLPPFDQESFINVNDHDTIVCQRIQQ